MAAETEKVTYGLREVRSGDSGTDGALGSALTKHGEHLKGTVQIETSDETINNIVSEEGGVNIAIGQNDSATTATFEVLNPSLAIMAYYMGGTVETGPPSSWGKPKEATEIIKSFFFETIAGFNVIIPYGKVTAKPLGGTIGTDSAMTLQVVVTAMQPADEDAFAIMFEEKPTT